MPLTRRLALATLLAISCVGAAERPAAQDAHVSLAGQLLIASPSMGDPRFQRTVILMVKHDKSGAFGVVINKPIGERPLADILGAGDKDASGKVSIFWGGPVEPQLGFVLHSTDYRRAQTIEIDGRVAMTSSREILLDIGGNKGPARSLTAFGYAGWGPGQLEGEITARGWYAAPASSGLIFEEDREKVWDIAVSQRTQDL